MKILVVDDELDTALISPTLEDEGFVCSGCQCKRSPFGDFFSAAILHYS